MIKFLVPRFGVRVYEKNFLRETCRDRAVEGGHQHVVEYLDSDFPTLKSKVSTTSAHLQWTHWSTWLGTYVHNNLSYIG